MNGLYVLSLLTEVGSLMCMWKKHFINSKILTGISCALSLLDNKAFNTLHEQRVTLSLKLFMFPQVE